MADSIRWPAAPVIAPADWLPLRARAGGPPGSGADETRAPARYRLAGTLLLRTDDGTVRYGRAIIDDTEEKRQLVLAEQETSGDLRVLRIDWNRATVEIAGQVYTLSMRFAGNVAPPSEPGGVIAAAASAAPLEVSRFGRKVQPDRWLIEREAVLEYYRELRDDPVRVARLYESFRPVREGPDGHITGYELNILGEEEFLRAVGLQQGDVVRAVNSMPMTSQSRAEFFIAEFLKENLNAIVLDIERNRQPQKLVYLIR
ncbi:MAG: hypothetical protein N2652_00755 [Kiritimatiellae bacterium]|nr:hypothetical protein [Kiritimatiellia bacterium]